MNKSIFNRIQLALWNSKGESYVDTGVKMLIAIVIGALILTGIYSLMKDVVMDGVETKIVEFFDGTPSSDNIGNGSGSDNGGAGEQQQPTTTFTIDGVEYQALEGMSWREWCVSDYNTIGLYMDESSGDVLLSDGTYLFTSDGGRVSESSDRHYIVSGESYKIMNGPSSLPEKDPALNPDDGSEPADGDVYTQGDYKYTYSETNGGWSVYINTAVTDYNQTSYGEILESINGKPIVRMHNTFYECANLTEAPVIPDSVTDMSYTFLRCTSLTKAPEIPDSVIIMSRTFYECISLTVAPEIPESVTDMSQTFNGCTNLTDVNIVIPESVIKMDCAFYNCTSLTGTIEINANPDVYNSCFGKIDMKNITLVGNSSMLNEIGFTGANWLPIPDGTEHANGDGYIYGDYKYTYEEANGGWKISVTDQRKTSYGEIQASYYGKPVVNMDSSFAFCRNLIEAPVIPDSVTSMKATFQDCTSLTEAPVIPDGVTSMYNTFNGCTSLTDVNVVIPNSVTDMYQTFADCTSLTGAIEINVNPYNYYRCFYNVDMSKVTLTGTSTMLNTLGATGNNWTPIS